MVKRSEHLREVPRVIEAELNPVSLDDQLSRMLVPVDVRKRLFAASNLNPDYPLRDTNHFPEGMEFLEPHISKRRQRMLQQFLISSSDTAGTMVILQEQLAALSLGDIQTIFDTTPQNNPLKRALFSMKKGELRAKAVKNDITTLGAGIIMSGEQLPKTGGINGFESLPSDFKKTCDNFERQLRELDLFDFEEIEAGERETTLSVRGQVQHTRTRLMKVLDDSFDPLDARMLTRVDDVSKLMAPRLKETATEDQLFSGTKDILSNFESILTTYVLLRDVARRSHFAQVLKDPSGVLFVPGSNTLMALSDKCTEYEGAVKRRTFWSGMFDDEFMLTTGFEGPYIVEKDEPHAEMREQNRTTQLLCGVIGVLNQCLNDIALQARQRIEHGENQSTARIRKNLKQGFIAGLLANSARLSITRGFNPANFAHTNKTIIQQRRQHGAFDARSLGDLHARAHFDLARMSILYPEIKTAHAICSGLFENI